MPEASQGQDQMYEFWRLPQVQQAVGLSKSEIYRRIGRGEFPAPRSYPGTMKKFWLSTDVRLWQMRALGDPVAGMLG